MTDKPDGFNKGGMVHGIDDPTLLERLSRGEFTRNAADVARHGPEFMAKLNALARPKMTLVIGDERHEGLSADPDILARLEKHAIAQQAADVARHGLTGKPGARGTTNPATTWTDDAKAELHLLGMNLHNLSVELSRQHPCASTILEGYANRIDELMKRAPEVVS